jgi:hypothetical protein
MCAMSEQPEITCYSGSSYLKVSQRTEKKAELEPDEEPKTKRGKISEFTKKSRLRMQRELSKVRRDALPILVTLTYPGEYSAEPKVWKRDLDNFSRRMAREYPNVAGVWKLEPQKRGAPHFHLLVWGMLDVNYHLAYFDGTTGLVPAEIARLVRVQEIREWVSQAWYEVVGSGDEKHLRAGTRVEDVRSLNGVSAYLKKYLGKEVPPEWENAGRWWGIFQRENMPYGELVVLAVRADKVQEIIRYMRRFAHIRSRAYKSLTITCNADFWLNKVLSPPGG